MRSVVAKVAACACGLAVGVAMVAGCSGSRDSAGGSGGPRGGSSASVPAAGTTADDAVVAATDALLAERERAITTADTAAHAALVADPASAAGAALLQQFSVLSALPWERLAQDRPRVVESAPTASAGSRALEVTTRWRLAGERADSREQERVVVTQVDGAWRLVEVSGTATAVAPWWGQGVGIARATHGVVIGSVDAGTRQQLATDLDRAHGLAAAAWPVPTAPRLTVIAPRTAAEYAAVTGGTESAKAQVAAITDGPTDAEGKAVADRVIINPEAWQRLSAEGRAFVLAHEAVHVVIRSDVPGQAPLWLSEGYADWVAYAPTGLPAEEIAAQALDEVRAGRMPSGLPTQGDYNAAAAAIGPSYQRSWVLVSMLVDEFGAARVCEFIRAATVSGSQADAEAAADRAFGTVLGTSRDAVVIRWQSRLAQLAGTA